MKRPFKKKKLIVIKHLQLERLVPFWRQRVWPHASGSYVASGQAAQTVALLPTVAALEAQPEAMLTPFILRSARRSRQRCGLYSQHAVGITKP